MLQVTLMRRHLLAATAAVSLAAAACDTRGIGLVEPEVRGDRSSGVTFLVRLEESATTVYLDGMLSGTVWAVVGEIAELSCTESETWRNDPLGVWSFSMHMFPGTGLDYPVAPGQAVTVATDAVDHSVADPGLPDLSDANFEPEGTADPDNADVPNVPYLGPEADRWRRGMHMRSKTMFLAQATDFQSLERRRSFRGYEYARVPTSRLLDVVRLVDGQYYTIQKIVPPCGLSAPRSLERLEGGEFTLIRKQFTLRAVVRCVRGVVVLGGCGPAGEPFGQRCG